MRSLHRIPCQVVFARTSPITALIKQLDSGCFPSASPYNDLVSLMSTIRSIAAFSFLLVSACVYGQSNPAERRAADFDSNGVCLTETLLAFSRQEHLPIAIEYIDRASMEQPIGVNLQNKTVQEALDSILLHGDGYRWRLRNGIIEITNR